MRAHLRYLWFRLTASLWLVPAAMIFGAIVLAMVMLTLEGSLLWDDWAEPLQWLLPVGADGSRQLLATIAGSMITVASLVFSMTLVTLTLASSQLGPRLIARFMRDRINQVVLGTFLATFVYALLILQTVTDSGDQEFVPHLAVLVALLLALVSLGWLIYFIHHVADSIQADSVIADIGDELSDAIKRRFPELAGSRPLPLETPFLDRLATPAGVVAGRGSGYVQAIDAAALLQTATREGLLIQVEARPGDFVVEGAPLLRVWPRERLSDELARKLCEPVVIGPKRTSTQDIDFAMSALVEIALRALSPGINDPRTAIACIDRLTQGLVEMIQLPDPPALVPDDDGTLRLIVKPAGFADVIAGAFDPIREAGRNQAWVLRRLAEVLALLAGFVRTPEQHSILARQAAVLDSVCREAPLDQASRARVDESLELLRRALADSREER